MQTVTQRRKYLVKRGQALVEFAIGLTVLLLLVFGVNGQTTTATGTYTKPGMTSPANGSTFNSGSATFSWDAVPGATQYALWMGSSAGTWDLYAAFESGRSRTLTLPTDGRTLYVRLFSYVNGAWQSNAYTYTAYTSPIAEMVSPPPGSILTGDRVNFEWAIVPGVTYYALWLGTATNSWNLYSGIQTGQSRTVKVPTDGKPLYVTLWTWSNGQWRSNAYTYTAYGPSGPVKAALSSPADAAILTGDRVNIEWTSGVGVKMPYYLWVGTTTNSFNLHWSSETGLSRVVKVPTDGKPVYVTLWSYVNGGWQSDARSYTAYNKAVAEKATMTVPPPSSILPGAATKFSWNSGVGATRRALWVGSSASSYDLYAGFESGLWRALMLPKDGRTLYVRLWSLINGGWQWDDYQYTASGP